MSQLVGVVLAGGRGRRMGCTKGEMVIEGSTMARSAAGVLFPLCGGVIISLAEGMENPAPDYPAVRDFPPAGRGPLAGIQAAYAETGNADLLVLACDYPNVRTEHLAALLKPEYAGHDLTMPVDRNGRDHPLVAVWRRPARNTVDAAMAEGRYKVRALLAEMSVCRVQHDKFHRSGEGAVLANINTAADLDGLD